MSFRDAFTKDDKEQLMYDDSAFMYFFAAVLTCVAIPLTVKVVIAAYRQYMPDFGSKGRMGPRSSLFPMRSSGKTRSPYKYILTAPMCANMRKLESSASSQAWHKRLSVRMAALAVLWGVIALLYIHVSSFAPEIKAFDPFEILRVSAGAGDKEIKKAYRTLSLEYHPDRNPNNPQAQFQFIQITKAYQALVDEVAKSNYEKYGNPDGPTASKIGIGLPSFFLIAENQVFILGCFFFVILFVVPVCFISLYRKLRLYMSEGVLRKTAEFMTVYINEGTRAKNAPELLACSVESRNMSILPTDAEEMGKIAPHVVETIKPKFDKLPIVVRNRILITAYCQRLQHMFNSNTQKAVTELVRNCLMIVPTMIEIALCREWFPTAVSLIEFSQCLVQALPVDGGATGIATLLQIPHFTEELVGHATKGKGAVSSISEFTKLFTKTLEKGSIDSKDGLADLKQIRGLVDMTKPQLEDIDLFVRNVGRLEVTGNVAVDDEEEIAEGDVATCKITVNRTQLSEGQAQGPVHAPLLPAVKFEDLWLLVTTATGNRIVHFARVRSQEKVVEESFKFRVGPPGKHMMSVVCLSDSYAGFPIKVDVSFQVVSKAQIAKEIKVHPEDASLDKMPTLFEQMMGISKDEEEESDDDEPIKKKESDKAAPAAQNGAQSSKLIQSTNGDVQSGSESSGDSN